jgi:hypothetical protein
MYPKRVAQVSKRYFAKAGTTRDSFPYLNSCETLTKQFFSLNYDIDVIKSFLSGVLLYFIN